MKKGFTEKERKFLWKMKTFTRNLQKVNLTKSSRKVFIENSRKFIRN
ncbi:7115_t:CDS:2 [Entrophospora sp. SA101]|nr:7106_t:CDS:2 [Entrophospora sp. SA101]CAJ0846558.1 7115_t:CDS:2 [Entrophospora sp. SA101]